jgi:hypothetical protein
MAQTVQLEPRCCVLDSSAAWNAKWRGGLDLQLFGEGGHNHARICIWREHLQRHKVFGQVAELLVHLWGHAPTWEV